MESNLTFTLIFCSALCAIITFSTRGRGCGFTWVGGMGCGKFYGRSFMESCDWCYSHRLKSTLFIYKWSLCSYAVFGIPKQLHTNETSSTDSLSAGTCNGHRCNARTGNFKEISYELSLLSLLIIINCLQNSEIPSVYGH